jgi:hypothetical protein
MAYGFNPIAMQVKQVNLGDIISRNADKQIAYDQANIAQQSSLASLAKAQQDAEMQKQLPDIMQRAQAGDAQAQGLLTAYFPKIAESRSKQDLNASRGKLVEQQTKNARFERKDKNRAFNLEKENILADNAREDRKLQSDNFYKRQNLYYKQQGYNTDQVKAMLEVKELQQKIGKGQMEQDAVTADTYNRLLTSNPDAAAQFYQENIAPQAVNPQSAFHEMPAQPDLQTNAQLSAAVGAWQAVRKQGSAKETTLSKERDKQAAKQLAEIDQKANKALTGKAALNNIKKQYGELGAGSTGYIQGRLYPLTPAAQLFDKTAAQLRLLNNPYEGQGAVSNYEREMQNLASLDRKMSPANFAIAAEAQEKLLDISIQRQQAANEYVNKNGTLNGFEAAFNKALDDQYNSDSGKTGNAPAAQGGNAPDMQAKIDQAKAAGYSDAEIQQYIQGQR